MTSSRTDRAEPATRPRAGRIRRSDEKAHTPEILWGSVGTTLVVMGMAAVWFAPQVLPAWPRCVVKATTGIPCPTCGGTRAAVALLHGHLLQALTWNPLVGLGLAGLALYLPYAWLTMAGVIRPVRTGWTTPPMPVWLRWTLPALLAANWIYLLAVGR
ncbi:MAG: DUF2752 domain-containing protein [Acidobacteriota bacterium]